MELKFPLLGGGTVSGLNDAGIETFEGDFASNVVRECAQNSLDVAIGHPVTIEITRHSLPAEELSFLTRLRDVRSESEPSKPVVPMSRTLTLPTEEIQWSGWVYFSMIILVPLHDFFHERRLKAVQR
jgi:hypothetical protein